LTDNFDLQKGELTSFLCIVILMKKMDIPGSGKPTANKDAKATIKCKEKLYCGYKQKRADQESLDQVFCLFFVLEKYVEWAVDQRKSLTGMRP